MTDWRTPTWRIHFIVASRAATVGLAYLSVVDLPGLTSSFVAIFVSLLAFDLMVALPTLLVYPHTLRQFLASFLPWFRGTILTLGAGLLIGTIFGIAVHVGVHRRLAAVLTVGSAYTAALRTKGNISSYVGILGALAVFETVAQVELEAGRLLAEVAPVAYTTVRSTFVALAKGWGVGLLVGLITRLLLPRGFRSLASRAYDPPLELHPLRDVLHIGPNLVLSRFRVERDSPLIGVSLAETHLRERFGATILSVERGEDLDMPLPTGSESLAEGDVVIVLSPVAAVKQVAGLMKGSGARGK